MSDATLIEILEKYRCTIRWTGERWQAIECEYPSTTESRKKLLWMEADNPADALGRLMEKIHQRAAQKRAWSRRSQRLES